MIDLNFKVGDVVEAGSDPSMDKYRGIGFTVNKLDSIRNSFSIQFDGKEVSFLASDFEIRKFHGRSIRVDDTVFLNGNPIFTAKVIRLFRYNGSETAIVDQPLMGPTQMGYFPGGWDFECYLLRKYIRPDGDGWIATGPSMMLPDMSRVDPRITLEVKFVDGGAADVDLVNIESIACRNISAWRVHPASGEERMKSAWMNPKEKTLKKILKKNSKVFNKTKERSVMEKESKDCDRWVPYGKSTKVRPSEFRSGFMPSALNDYDEIVVMTSTGVYSTVREARTFNWLTTLGDGTIVKYKVIEPFDTEDENKESERTMKDSNVTHRHPGNVSRLDMTPASAGHGRSPGRAALSVLLSVLKYAVVKPIGYMLFTPAKNIMNIFRYVMIVALMAAIGYKGYQATKDMSIDSVKESVSSTVSSAGSRASGFIGGVFTFPVITAQSIKHGKTTSGEDKIIVTVKSSAEEVIREYQTIAKNSYHIWYDKDGKRIENSGVLDSVMVVYEMTGDVGGVVLKEMPY